MSRTRRAVGWGFVGASLLLHAFTVLAYVRQPDPLAAFTVFPVWFWGGIGLLMSVFAFCFLRAPLSLIVTAVWAVTLSVAMDEAKALSNFNHPKISLKRSVMLDGQRIIRVATVNCAGFAYGDPVDDLKRWDPDIVLLQDAAPHRVKRIAEVLYGGGGDFRAYQTNGIVTRFGILREVRNPVTRNQQVTMRLPEGTEIEVVNIHLASAATDMRLWNSESRALHRQNRDLRRKELSLTLQVLQQTSPLTTTPTIFGGDFNSGSADVVHRQLIPDYDDAFSMVGRGWGDTFHRRFPILRIDHIYATRQLQPLSCGVIVSRMTDHRMVIADLRVRQ